MYMKLSHIKQHGTPLRSHTSAGVSSKAGHITGSGCDRDPTVQGFETLLSRIVVTPLHCLSRAGIKKL